MCDFMLHLCSTPAEFITVRTHTSFYSLLQLHATPKTKYMIPNTNDIIYSYQENNILCEILPVVQMHHSNWNFVFCALIFPRQITAHLLYLTNKVICYQLSGWIPADREALSTVCSLDETLLVSTYGQSSMTPVEQITFVSSSTLDIRSVDQFRVGAEFSSPV